MSANILIYGNDRLLLLTRRLVLQQVGYRVLTTSEFDHAITLTANEQIDLLILCQTLRQRDRRRVLETARGVKPMMKKLILDAAVAPTQLLENETVVDGFIQAKTLVDTVDGLLGVKVTQKEVAFG